MNRHFQLRYDAPLFPAIYFKCFGLLRIVMSPDVYAVFSAIHRIPLHCSVIARIAEAHFAQVFQILNPLPHT